MLIPEWCAVQGGAPVSVAEAVNVYFPHLFTCRGNFEHDTIGGAGNQGIAIFEALNVSEGETPVAVWQ